MEKSRKAADKPQGLVAIYVVDDRVVASVADFNGQQYSGFNQIESQRIRAKDALSRAVVNAYCASVVANSLHLHDCHTIVKQIPGKMHIIPVGYDTDRG